MKKLFAWLVALGLLMAACTPGAAGVSTAYVSTAYAIGTGVAGTAIAVTAPPADYTPPPFPTPVPPTAVPPLPGGSLSPTELKYKLLDQFPDFFFCDPDFYPVAHDDETQLAIQRFPEIQANTEEFQSILAHNNMAGQTTFTDDQKLVIYKDYKKLNAIPLELAGDKYQFQLQVSQNNSQGFIVKGTIDGEGNINVDSKTPSIATCPICLALGTRIDTPNGQIPVQDLRPGDLVWTVDAHGARVAEPLIEAGHVAVPPSHRIVHLVLADGRELWASPGHPTADGRRLGQLQAGDFLDGSRILKAELLPYTAGATYDVLPAGATGFYWADSILIASTLAR